MKEYFFLGAGVSLVIINGIFSKQIDELSQVVSGPCISLDEQISLEMAGKHISKCLSFKGEVETTEQFSKSSESILIALSEAKENGKEKLFNSDVAQINKELKFIRDELIDRGEI